MTPEQAVQLVHKQFPFEGYINRREGAYLNIAKTVLRFLQTGSKILDFGSGPCDTAAVLQMLGFKCSAYDDLEDHWHKVGANKEKILAFAKRFGIDFRQASNKPLPFKKDYYDMLMMNDVLEHLHNSPRNLLNELLNLVKPQGLFLATVPNAVNIRKRVHVLLGRTNLPDFNSYYWAPDPWRGHIREYTRGDLIKLAENLNLEILELRSYHHMLQKVPIFAKSVYLALTKIFTGWRDSWLLVAKKRPKWVPVKSLRKDEAERIFGMDSPYLYEKD